MRSVCGSLCVESAHHTTPDTADARFALGLAPLSPSAGKRLFWILPWACSPGSCTFCRWALRRAACAPLIWLRTGNMFLGFIIRSVCGATARSFHCVDATGSPVGGPGLTMFHHLRNCHLFWSCHMVLCPHQWYMRLPVPPRPHQTYRLFFIVTVLEGVKWYLTVTLVAFPPMTHGLFAISVFSSETCLFRLCAHRSSHFQGD